MKGLMEILYSLKIKTIERTKVFSSNVAAFCHLDALN